jgi:hypothetical protein
MLRVSAGTLFVAHGRQKLSDVPSTAATSTWALSTPPGLPAGAIPPEYVRSWQ